jgi:hypothetical protein
MYMPLLSHIRATCPSYLILLALSPELYWMRSTIDPFNMHVVLSLLRIWRYLPGSMTDIQTTGLAFSARYHFIVQPVEVTVLPNCVL